MTAALSDRPLAHIVRSGHGPEPALLLHCMLGRSKAMKKLMEQLADDLSMVAVDLPGHGGSPDWDPSRDYGDMTLEMAFEALDHPAHLIGHSFGAYIALRMAVEQPELVRSLTLIEPVFFVAAGEEATDVLDAHKDEAAQYLNAIAAGDLEAAARGFTAHWGSGDAWESLRPAAAEYMMARMPLVAATEGAILEDNAGLLPRLNGVAASCLLIEGANSPRVIAAVQAELARRIPQARREVVQGAAHMSPMSHPEEVAALIADFIKDQPRSAASI